MALPWITWIRQNHALEHATMHVLSARYPFVRLVGRSDWRGFCLYGKVETEAVMWAAQEALARLQGDESWLAVHPNCGTNLTVTTLLAGSTAYAAAALSNRSWVRRMVGVSAAIAVTLFAGRALGLAAQRHITTTADLRGVRLRSVQRETRGQLIIHRVQVGHRSEPDD